MLVSSSRSKAAIATAIVTEQGATLHRVIWAGTDLLNIASDDGYAVHGGYGQLLAPWPGRIRNAVYDFDGEHFELRGQRPQGRRGDPWLDALVHMAVARARR